MVIHQQSLVLNRRGTGEYLHVKNTLVRQFGAHVRALRKKHDLTQEELAGRSRISLKYIQKIEGKDPQNPSLEILQKLADGFELPLWKMLKFE